MIERAFEVLFVLALVAPPATVVVGALLLAWPRQLVHGVDQMLRTTSRA